MWYVYALKSAKDGNLYIGISSNPEKRIKQHNLGMTKSTRSRRPLEIIYQQECKDRLDARKKEKHLKSGVGREFLKNL
jgi:putative endonuclease